MSNCLFCGIVNNTILTKITYKDKNIIIVDDISPQAPVHKLIIPQKHIATLNELQQTEQILIAEMVYAAKKTASELGFSQEGYRLVFNCNQKAGQTVFHIHLHLLAGRQFDWPPG